MVSSNTKLPIFYEKKGGAIAPIHYNDSIPALTLTASIACQASNIQSFTELGEALGITTVSARNIFQTKGRIKTSTLYRLIALHTGWRYGYPFFPKEDDVEITEEPIPLTPLTFNRSHPEWQNAVTAYWVCEKKGNQLLWNYFKYIRTIRNRYIDSGASFMDLIALGYQAPPDYEPPSEITILNKRVKHNKQDRLIKRTKLSHLYKNKGIVLPSLKRGYPLIDNDSGITKDLQLAILRYWTNQLNIYGTNGIAATLKLKKDYVRYVMYGGISIHWTIVLRMLYLLWMNHADFLQAKPWKVEWTTLGTRPHDIYLDISCTWKKQPLQTGIFADYTMLHEIDNRNFGRYYRHSIRNTLGTKLII